MFRDDGHPRVSGIRIKPKYLSRAVSRVKRDATLAPHMKKRIFSSTFASRAHGSQFLSCAAVPVSLSAGTLLVFVVSPIPSTPTSLVQHSGSSQLCFHFRQRLEKEEEGGGGRWKTENTVRENRGPLVCVRVLNPPPRSIYLFGSVLVSPCVRPHRLTNMCPARQLSPDSEGLQTNMSTHDLDIFLRPIPSRLPSSLSPSPPTPRPRSLLLPLLPTVSFRRS